MRWMFLLSMAMSTKGEDFLDSSSYFSGVKMGLSKTLILNNMSQIIVNLVLNQVNGNKECINLI